MILNSWTILCWKCQSLPGKLPAFLTCIYISFTYVQFVWLLSSTSVLSPSCWAYSSRFCAEMFVLFTKHNKEWPKIPSCHCGHTGLDKSCRHQWEWGRISDTLPRGGMRQERAKDGEFKYNYLNTTTRILSRIGWPSPAGCETATVLEET